MTGGRKGEKKKKEKRMRGKLDIAARRDSCLAARGRLLIDCRSAANSAGKGKRKEEKKKKGKREMQGRVEKYLPLKPIGRRAAREQRLVGRRGKHRDVQRGGEGGKRKTLPSSGSFERAVWKAPARSERGKKGGEDRGGPPF